MTPIKLKTCFTLLQREYWENKNAFIQRPFIISSLISLILLFIFFKVIYTHNWQNLPLTAEFNATNHLKNIFNPEFASHIILTIAAFIGLVTWIGVFFYFLNTLYRERQTKNIYFWLSMPISHSETLFSKYFFGLILAPLISCFYILAISFLCLILITISGHILHIENPSTIWNISNLMSTFLSLFVRYFIQLIYLLPLFSWALLCSQYAKRSPFICAVMPILILSIIESFFFQTHFFSQYLFHPIIISQSIWLPDALKNFHFSHMLLQQWLVGVGFSVFCIGITLWLRYRCYRIQ